LQSFGCASSAQGTGARRSRRSKPGTTVIGTISNCTASRRRLRRLVWLKQSSAQRWRWIWRSSESAPPLHPSSERRSRTGFPHSAGPDQDERADQTAATLAVTRVGGSSTTRVRSGALVERDRDADVERSGDRRPCGRDAARACARRARCCTYGIGP